MRHYAADILQDGASVHKAKGTMADVPGGRPAGSPGRNPIEKARDLVKSRVEREQQSTEDLLIDVIVAA
jgi:hypothetical protein